MPMSQLGAGWQERARELLEVYKADERDGLAFSAAAQPQVYKSFVADLAAAQERGDDEAFLETFRKLLQAEAPQALHDAGNLPSLSTTLPACLSTGCARLIGCLFCDAVSQADHTGRPDLCRLHPG